MRPRKFRWEYLLSAATRNAGRFQSLLVTRCLRSGDAIRSPRPPASAIRGERAGTHRRRNMNSRMRKNESVQRSTPRKRARAAWSGRRTLPSSKLKEMAGEPSWDAIHVSGVDTHHAAWLVDGFYDAFKTTEVIDDSDHLHDGMICAAMIRANSLSATIIWLPFCSPQEAPAGRYAQPVLFRCTDVARTGPQRRARRPGISG